MSPMRCHNFHGTSTAFVMASVIAWALVNLGTELSKRRSPRMNAHEVSIAGSDLYHICPHSMDTVHGVWGCSLRDVKGWVFWGAVVKVTTSVKGGHPLSMIFEQALGLTFKKSQPWLGPLAWFDWSRSFLCSSQLNGIS